MSWLALLLIGLGGADLVRSVRPRLADPGLHGVGGAVVLVLTGLLAGLHSLVDALAVVVGVALVLAWAWATSGEDRSPRTGLAVLGGGVGLAVLASPWAPASAGSWSAWLGAGSLPGLADVDPDNALLVVGVLLVQLATGNHVVRLVLSATGVVAPRVAGTPQDPAQRLKGGRLLGPMERVVIVGLGLAGDLTAAAVVIAAKGLLRWPELQSRTDQHAVHRLTEYFLVGSFVSWLVAFAGLVVLG